MVAVSGLEKALSLCPRPCHKESVVIPKMTKIIYEWKYNHKILRGTTVAGNKQKGDGYVNMKKE